jgi:hypothetical protein
LLCLRVPSLNPIIRNASIFVYLVIRQANTLPFSIIALQLP